MHERFSLSRFDEILTERIYTSKGGVNYARCSVYKANTANFKPKLLIFGDICKLLY